MDDKLHKVFTGTSTEAWMLKGELEEIGIMAMIKDNLSSSLQAGFFGGTTSTVELYVNGDDLDKAGPLIRKYNDEFGEG
jgi:hypothetical protein